MKKNNARTTKKVTSGTYSNVFNGITKSDLELGEALLNHIEKFQSPVREQELVKFVMAWNHTYTRKAA